VNPTALAESYRSALLDYIGGGGDEALRQAYEVGRQALEAGIGPLVLFSIHRDVVQQLPPRPIEPAEFVSQVTTVFIEALASFQTGYASADEARAPLEQVGTILDRHQRELEAAQRRLEGSASQELLGMLERHAREVDESRKQLDSLPQTSEARRQLVAEIVHAQEEERRRLASEIHDDAIQSMTAVLLRVGLLGTRLRDQDQVELVGTLESSIRETIARLRRMIVGLAPPELDRAGLVAAVRSALEQLKAEFGIKYRLENTLEAEPSVEARTIAYRIVQEALVNARNHAEASEVEIDLGTEDRGVAGEVRDNGVGFDVDATLAEIRPGHLGLVTMRERADLAGGWCRVKSGPDGTSVKFWLPDRLRAGFAPGGAGEE
jgi:signal transduction histidine kinase